MKMECVSLPEFQAPQVLEYSECKAGFTMRYIAKILLQYSSAGIGLDRPRSHSRFFTQVISEAAREREFYTLLRLRTWTQFDGVFQTRI